MSVVQLQSVAKIYSQQIALDELSLAIEPGSRCVLLGPNGAGKSTLLNLITGAIQPSRGTVTVLGYRAGHIYARLNTGVMLQISGIPTTLKVIEHINSFRSYYLQPFSTEEVIQRSGLSGLEQRKYGTLSVGQQQRLNFALAICGNPQLLILDEPTSSLDLHTTIAVWEQIEMLAKNNYTLILATHNLREAERLASRVLVLHHGHVVMDSSPNALRSQFGDTQISMRTSIDAPHLVSLPTVKRVEQNGGLTHIYVSNAEACLRFILDRDKEVTELEVQKASLTDAYLHLVKGTN